MGTIRGGGLVGKRKIDLGTAGILGRSVGVASGVDAEISTRIVDFSGPDNPDVWGVSLVLILWSG